MTPFWLTLMVAIVTSMAGQVLLKIGATSREVPALSAMFGDGPLGAFAAQLLRWETVVGLGFYGAAALLYIVALRRIPMSVALPCTAISYVVAALVGYVAFGEPMGTKHAFALLLICSGVILLATA